jgi:endonuclease III
MEKLMQSSELTVEHIEANIEKIKELLQEITPMREQAKQKFYAADKVVHWLETVQKEAEELLQLVKKENI